MPFKNLKYDVTFSFAEENNAFVKEVAGHLKGRDLTYYYYKEDEVEAWGKDLRTHLSGIYSKQSRLCVIFVSADYKEKVWTKIELKNAQVRARKDIHEYLLPFKLDDTELPEIPPFIKYLSSKEVDSKALAEAIYKKIEQHRRRDTFLNGLYREVKSFFFSWKRLVATALVVLSAVFLLLEDRLTPVDALTLRLYERSRKDTKGSVCRDKWFSRSRGSGTCSWHHGVLMEVDTSLPAKTMEQCREEAKAISWLHQ